MKFKDLKKNNQVPKIGDRVKIIGEKDSMRGFGLSYDLFGQKGTIFNISINLDIKSFRIRILDGNSYWFLREHFRII